MNRRVESIVGCAVFAVVFVVLVVVTDTRLSQFAGLSFSLPRPFDILTRSPISRNINALNCAIMIGTLVACVSGSLSYRIALWRTKRMRDNAKDLVASGGEANDAATQSLIGAGSFPRNRYDGLRIPKEALEFHYRANVDDRLLEVGGRRHSRYPRGMIPMILIALGFVALGGEVAAGFVAIYLSHTFVASLVDTELWFGYAASGLASLALATTLALTTFVATYAVNPHHPTSAGTTAARSSAERDGHNPPTSSALPSNRSPEPFSSLAGTTPEVHQVENQLSTISGEVDQSLDTFLGRLTKELKATMVESAERLALENISARTHDAEAMTAALESAIQSARQGITEQAHQLIALLTQLTSQLVEGPPAIAAYVAENVRAETSLSELVDLGSQNLRSRNEFRDAIMASLERMHQEVGRHTEESTTALRLALDAMQSVHLSEARGGTDASSIATVVASVTAEMRQLFDPLAKSIEKVTASHDLLARSLDAAAATTEQLSRATSKIVAGIKASRDALQMLVALSDKMSETTKDLRAPLESHLLAAHVGTQSNDHELSSQLSAVREEWLESLRSLPPLPAEQKANS